MVSSGQAGTKGPDSGGFVKVELAGFAEIGDEVVRERDSHMQIRNLGHRSFKNLL